MNTNTKIRDIARHYIGMEPKDVGAKDWIEMGEKMVCEIQKIIDEHSLEAIREHSKKHQKKDALALGIHHSIRIFDPGSPCTNMPMVKPDDVRQISEIVGAGVRSDLNLTVPYIPDLKSISLKEKLKTTKTRKKNNRKKNTRKKSKNGK